MGQEKGRRYVGTKDTPVCMKGLSSFSVGEPLFARVALTESHPRALISVTAELMARYLA